MLTLTLTGLAADSSLAGGTNPRPVRRIGSVVAMFSGALLGAVLVLHNGLAWPLAIACGAAAVATGVYLLRPAPAGALANTRAAAPATGSSPGSS